jgi:predicted small lipoprotein YifL
MSISKLILCASLLPLLVACGQKGDLVPQPPEEPTLTGASFEQKERDLQTFYWNDATTRLRTRH